MVSPSNLWNNHRHFISQFRKTKIGDMNYDYLINNGINQRQLDQFVISGSHRKRSTNNIQNTDDQIEQLLSMGGHVAGGRALNSWLFSESDGDVDIFFNDKLKWIQATLLVHGNPEVDICLYSKKPYEIFDITASKFSYSKDCFDVHPDAHLALEMKILHIEKQCIFHPVATLRRMIKYAERYNFKISTSDFIYLVGHYSITNDQLIDQAKKHLINE